ncbi:MAG: hypothetical protein QXO01_07325 [Nitrososphaerota archaeon]
MANRTGSGVHKMKAKSLEDIQVVTRHKPKNTTYLRAVPRTTFFPHNGQVEIRILFAEATEKAKGKEGLCPCHRLPWAAHYVLEENSGSRVAHPTPPSMKEWEKRLTSVAEALRRLALAVAEGKLIAAE